ncbi:MAG TPA: type II toxin-antitoxin system VapC family toxin [Nakamurella sp.]
MDASALLLGFIPAEQRDSRTPDRLTGTLWHAPHLIDAECGHVMRRAARRGVLTATQGQVALDSAAGLIDGRFAHDRPLRDGAWSLRVQLSFCHALFVALAARPDLPLVTCDRRLASVPGLPCRVELVG